MKSRRSFFKKATMALGGLLVGSFKINALNKTNSSMESSESILEIKALGFQWETADPFLFCVHHEDYYPKGNSESGPDCSLEGRFIGQDFIVKDGFRMYHGEKIPGFPGHPHRGFETITVVRKGLVDHADSMGASGRYGNGDVQWMTAGRGVQHSEMFPLLNRDNENPLELFQIWLNLPKKNKMVAPHFKMLWNENIKSKVFTDENNKTTLFSVVTGAFDNLFPENPPPDSWACTEANKVAIWTIKLDKNAKFTIPAEEKGINRTLYYFRGNGLQVNGKEIPHYHSVRVNSNSQLSLENGNEESEILLLQGKPINEPIVQHGPFVMNSKDEIRQAFEDYQKDEFGGWPWPRRDQVHQADLGRFAKHADGSEEFKKG